MASQYGSKPHGRNGSREAVQRGALVLDKVVPGWASRVHLEYLDMNDINLCMLGQLFGTDVETSVAKEMYPELFLDADLNRGCGYSNGKRMIAHLLKDQFSTIDCSEDEELKALAAACVGVSNECFWAEEIASRLSKENA